MNMQRGQKKMSKSLKLEKVTLWTAVQTYGVKDSAVTSLDYIMDRLNMIDGDCSILDYDSEDYKLTKVKKKKFNDSSK